MAREGRRRLCRMKGPSERRLREVPSCFAAPGQRPRQAFGVEAGVSISFVVLPPAIFVIARRSTGFFGGSAGPRVKMTRAWSAMSSCEIGDQSLAIAMTSSKIRFVSDSMPWNGALVRGAAARRPEFRRDVQHPLPIWYRRGEQSLSRRALSEGRCSGGVARSRSGALNIRTDRILLRKFQPWRRDHEPVPKGSA
jgi:hypothetical protein